MDGIGHLATRASYMRSTSSLSEWSGQSSMKQPISSLDHGETDPFFSRASPPKDKAPVMAEPPQAITGHNLRRTNSHNSHNSSTSSHLGKVKTIHHLPNLHLHHKDKHPRDNLNVDSATPPRPVTPRPRVGGVSAMSALDSQIPEPARMKKARKTPCCTYKHEDHKHRMLMEWLGH